MSKLLNHIYACIDHDVLLKTANQKAVFQVLAGYSSYFRKRVFMSPGQLYQIKQIKDSTATRCLKYLKDIGYIELVKRGGASGREYTANLYKINMPDAYAERMSAVKAMSLEDQIKYAKRTLAKSGVDLQLLDALLLARDIKSEKKRSLAQIKIRDKFQKLLSNQ